MDQLDADMFVTAGFRLQSLPDLIVKEANLQGNTNADADRRVPQSARRRVGTVSDILNDPQNTPASVFADAAAIMQSAVYCTDRDARKPGNVVNPKALHRLDYNPN